MQDPNQDENQQFSQQPVQQPMQQPVQPQMTNEAPAQIPPAPIAPAAPATDLATHDNDHTLKLVAFVFSVIATVSMGWLILPLAWLLPMTIHAHGIYKGTKKNTTVFAVCSLLFVSLVSGILLLMSRRED